MKPWERPEKEHLPKPGRFALVCPKEGCGFRRFSEPGWVCPEHGESVVQENRSYLEQPVPKL